jgi:predicted  nucleic acid-binding Zn-ribbon protein
MTRGNLAGASEATRHGGDDAHLAAAAAAAPACLPHSALASWLHEEEDASGGGHRGAGIEGQAAQEEMALKELKELKEEEVRQRRQALASLQEEVYRLEASGVEARARELRAAEAEVWRLGGTDEVVASVQALRRKEALLEAMLVDCEKHVARLERDKRTAEAQARAVVDEMVRMERDMEAEVWRSAETRAGAPAAGNLRPMVAHERKIAALERQVRAAEQQQQQQHDASFALHRQLAPAKTEARLLDVEQELATARRRLKAADDAVARLNATVDDLRGKVAALEAQLGDAEASAVRAAEQDGQMAAADQTIAALRAELQRLQRQSEAASTACVQHEAAACSLTYQNICMKEALEASEVRAAQLISSLSDSWSQLRMAGINNTLEQLDLTLDTATGASVLARDAASPPLSLVHLGSGGECVGGDGRTAAASLPLPAPLPLPALEPKLQEAENLVREMTGFALDACARVERDGYHARRAGARLQADVTALRRRVAELECDLAESEALASKLTHERDALKQDVKLRETDENGLWRLVRHIEKSIEGGQDFDGVVASLLSGERCVACSAAHAGRQTSGRIAGPAAADRSMLVRAMLTSSALQNHAACTGPRWRGGTKRRTRS